MKRNFKVENGSVSAQEKLAILRMVNKLLSEVEKDPNGKISRLIYFADCTELQRGADEPPCLIPLGSTESDIIGFCVQDEGGTVCEVVIPALAEMTKRTA